MFIRNRLSASRRQNASAWCFQTRLGYSDSTRRSRIGQEGFNNRLKVTRETNFIA